MKESAQNGDVKEARFMYTGNVNRTPPEMTFTGSTVQEDADQSQFV